MIQPARTQTLSEQELYLFDTTGFLRVRGFLNGKDLERCREAVFSCPSRIMAGRGDKRRFDNLAGHNADLDVLARSKAIHDCVQPLINQPYRLIESYGLYREKDSAFYLHNGNSEHLAYGDGRRAQRNMSLSHTFHNGKLYCMLVKVIVLLYSGISQGQLFVLPRHH
jgi:hypothetical protein